MIWAWKDEIEQSNPTNWIKGSVENSKTVTKYDEMVQIAKRIIIPPLKKFSTHFFQRENIFKYFYFILQLKWQSVKFYNVNSKETKKNSMKLRIKIFKKSKKNHWHWYFNQIFYTFF